MKHIFLILFLFGSTLFGQFDNVGTSAANFLKIGVGDEQPAWAAQ